MTLMLDELMNEHGWLCSDTEVLWEKSAPVHLCQPHIPHELAWIWTQACALIYQWLMKQV